MGELVCRRLISFPDAISVMKRLKIRKHTKEFEWFYDLEEISDWEMKAHKQAAEKNVRGAIQKYASYDKKEQLVLFSVYRAKVNK